jgi:hypothetical protein
MEINRWRNNYCVQTYKLGICLNIYIKQMAPLPSYLRSWNKTRHFPISKPINTCSQPSPFVLPVMKIRKQVQNLFFNIYWRYWMLNKFDCNFVNPFKIQITRISILSGDNNLGIWFSDQQKELNYISWNSN